MAKYYGEIGYGEETMVRPGVYNMVITPRMTSGDMNRVISRSQNSDHVIDNLTLSNELSIIADPFASHNFHSIKYVKYMGTKWKVTSVEVQFPNLILSLGGVYNG